MDCCGLSSTGLNDIDANNITVLTISAFWGEWDGAGGISGVPECSMSMAGWEG